jgi:hypothetical protein
VALEGNVEDTRVEKVINEQVFELLGE